MNYLASYSPCTFDRPRGGMTSRHVRYMTSRILTCSELKGHVWRCLFEFLATCARLSCILSFWVHVKLFYRIVSYRMTHRRWRWVLLQTVRKSFISDDDDVECLTRLRLAIYWYISYMYISNFLNSLVQNQQQNRQQGCLLLIINGSHWREIRL